MNGWQSDKRFSDRFIPEIVQYIAPHIIHEAPLEEDTKHNTDLLVLKGETVRVGCRIRRAAAWCYRDEFTIRSSRPRGTETELAKLVGGWGDLFFYGHTDESEEQLRAWILGDLMVFRLWYNRQLYAGIKPGQKQHNINGDSEFLAFKIRDLPPEFVVAEAGLSPTSEPTQCSLFDQGAA